MNQAHQLPRVPIYDLTHWSEHVPSELDAKNQRAVNAWVDRLKSCKHFVNHQERLNKLIRGIAVKRRWINHFTAIERNRNFKRGMQ